jgi:signal transduction histidine kinase
MRAGLERQARSRAWSINRASVGAAVVNALRRARALFRSDEGQGLEPHLARVVHDLKQPLTALSVSLDMLALTVPASPHVNRCQRAIRRQYELIDDLVALTSKIELAEVVDLATLLGEVVEDLRPSAEKRNVELVVEVRADTRLRGNELALRRAFSNVVTNAIEMTAHGSRVEVVLDRERSLARVDVRDQGPGVPLELRERAFEPFFTTRGNGTGLGLAIARASVKAHRGTVRFVASEGGHVRFELPSRRTPRENQRADAADLRYLSLTGRSAVR